jgi:pyridoxamine 5'-phosphate oxidase
MSQASKDPLALARTWLDEERANGVAFPQGAVLATQGLDGIPRSRMLGAYLTPEGRFIFYTSPTSRKVQEIARSPLASLTFGFQRSLRSITVEGKLAPLETS